jgi:alpha-L-rhamnosidase
MFSGASATLYSRFGGIRPSESGYRRIVVDPAMTDSLDWVRVRVETVRGRVQSEWRRSGATLTLIVEIPVGADAEVRVPALSPDDVYESGVPAAKAAGVKYLGTDARAEVFSVGSGVYRFSTHRKSP